MTSVDDFTSKIDRSMTNNPCLESTHADGTGMMLTLEDRSPSAIRSAFESLSSLAMPDLRDWARNIARTHVKHYSAVFSCVERIVKDHEARTLLDVGAVPGFISVTLSNSGLDVQAVDINPSRTLDIFRAGGVWVHQVDIEHQPLPFDNNSFDIVLFNEVLEHMRINPILPLREIYRVLRPDGHLVLSTPNITLPMRLRFLFGRDYQDDIIHEFRKLETIGHMGHFRLYSRSEVFRLLAHLGFRVDSYHAHSVASSGTWKRRVLERLLPQQSGDHLYVIAAKSRSENES